MKLTEPEKGDLIRAFTSVNKIKRGKGPKNIVVKQNNNFLRIVMDGALSEFEKYHLKLYGASAEAFMKDLNKSDFSFIEEEVNKKLEKVPKITLIDFECDFHLDQIAYVAIFNRTEA